MSVKMVRSEAIRVDWCCMNAGAVHRKAGVLSGL